MGKKDQPESPITPDSLAASTVEFPETVFLLGASLDHAAPELRQADAENHLGLGSALALTPPHWVHLDSFRLGRRMVTNGEYMRFLGFVDEDGPGERIYDHAELWDEVWHGLNYRIDRAFASMRAPDGGVEVLEESYGDATGFVDAYVASIRYEIIRLLERESVPRQSPVDKDSETRFFLMKRADGVGTRRVPLRRGAVIHRLFAFIKHALQDALISPDGDEPSTLTPKERQALAVYNDDRGKLMDDIEDVIERLRARYGEHVDPRLRGLFAAGKHRVETILFLERFRRALEVDPDADSVPLHKVLYPRWWPTPEGKRRGTLISPGGRKVPWEDRPVVGLTLYEALGYTVWLSSLSGVHVTLPNEAEYERASSWPREAGDVSSKKISVDPKLKDLLPWQRQGTADFHTFFGRQGEDIENFYGSDRRAYDRLLEDTSRLVGDHDRLYMMEGFGWQWTVDRLDDDEVRYSRFEDPGYRRWDEKPCRLAGDGKRKLEVFEYRANTKIDSSHFVLKGSPEIVGGPGITTRRYSANPLRGYQNVGFRIATQPESESESESESD